MIVPVYVWAGGKELIVYALLDTQSDASFITSSLAIQSNLKYTTEKITMSTLHGETTKPLNRYSINIKGYGMNDAQKLRVQVYEQSSIPCNRSQIPNQKQDFQQNSSKDGIYQLVYS